MTDTIYTLHRGNAPLLVSLPHDGSEIPKAMAARMTPAARRAPDTDWHVGRLYAFAMSLGASVLGVGEIHPLIALLPSHGGIGKPPASVAA